ncbi:transcription repressor myb5 [Anaeramoeba flamelloides]|uniref:Transcription repressor myb5 n=1 Tax=Anaeramoeba flamelloides TaxID=1746091 RepID=A0ABQ8YMG1_9EUKA|nr:transcription repressor myb5 [Anaeramoeba flamelloides]
MSNIQTIKNQKLLFEEIKIIPALSPVKHSKNSIWSKYEDEILARAVQKFKGKDWDLIAEYLFNKEPTQCLHRWKKVLNPELKKGPWTKEEDNLLIKSVKTHGDLNWAFISSQIPKRTSKQCRERWKNQLDPNIKRSSWTKEEDEILIKKQILYGNSWCKIKVFLPGRPDNMIKNRWNSTLKKQIESGNYSLDANHKNESKNKTNKNRKTNTNKKTKLKAKRKRTRDKMKRKHKARKQNQKKKGIDDFIISDNEETNDSDYEKKKKKTKRRRKNKKRKKLKHMSISEESNDDIVDSMKPIEDIPNEKTKTNKKTKRKKSKRKQKNRNKLKKKKKRSKSNQKVSERKPRDFNSFSSNEENKILKTVNNAKKKINIYQDQRKNFKKKKIYLKNMERSNKHKKTKVKLKSMTKPKLKLISKTKIHSVNRKLNKKNGKKIQIRLKFPNLSTKKISNLNKAKKGFVKKKDKNDQKKTISIAENTFRKNNTYKNFFNKPQVVNTKKNQLYSVSKNKSTLSKEYSVWKSHNNKNKMNSLKKFHIKEPDNNNDNNSNNNNNINNSNNNNNMDINVQNEDDNENENVISPFYEELFPLSDFQQMDEIKNQNIKNEHDPLTRELNEEEPIIHFKPNNNILLNQQEENFSVVDEDGHNHNNNANTNSSVVVMSHEEDEELSHFDGLVTSNGLQKDSYFFASYDYDYPSENQMLHLQNNFTIKKNDPFDSFVNIENRMNNLENNSNQKINFDKNHSDNTLN